MKYFLKAYLVAFIIMVLPFLSLAQDIRVEPPFWWTGMKNNELQLMVHAENIASTQPVIGKEGVEIKDLITTDNPNYLFVDLRIKGSAELGTFDIVFMEEGKTRFTYNYELKEREKNSAKREGFNSSDVICLAYPDRFANGDPSNDVVKTMNEKTINRSDPYGRHGGDLQGIINHLDYISDMGFTALWLNPVLENDMPEASYHGYAITDFYKVDPRLGDIDLYLELSRKASEKGIKLIMDMVFNHCGSKHWWMNDLPSSDWINLYPDYKITNHKRTVNQDIYASEKDKKLMVEGWFVPSMPDLNQNNPLLKNYLIQNSIWWIEYLDLGGIRMDTYPYPQKEMMAEWCEKVLDEYPNFNIVGEEWSENPVIVSYWQKGKKNHDGYKPHLPSVMDFPLQIALVKALTEEESWGTGLVRLYEALAMDFLYPDPDNITIFPDNHDMPRFYMQLGMDRELFHLGIAYILTIRGIPQIYYGTEILMDHTEGDGHGYIRKDFPGGWKGDKVNAFTGEGMSKEALETQEIFKKILNWRKTSEGIHSGKLLHFAPSENVYVFFRYNQGKKVMVILNKNTEKYTLELSRFEEIMNGTKKGTEVISGEILDLGEGQLELKPITPYIIEF